MCVSHTTSGKVHHYFEKSKFFEINNRNFLIKYSIPKTSAPLRGVHRELH